MTIDSKYIPFIIALILSIIIFIILIRNAKKSKREQRDEWLIKIFEITEEIYYQEMVDLIAKFKTYTIGNNAEHSKIIDAINESVGGSVENLKHGIFIPKEAKAEIGEDERIKVAFDVNKQNIDAKRTELKELIKNYRKIKH